MCLVFTTLFENIFSSFYLQIYLYGGYFKEVASDKEKGTVHADMWSLDPRTWEWNKVNTYNCLIINLLSIDFYLPLYLHPGICTLTIF